MARMKPFPFKVVTIVQEWLRGGCYSIPDCFKYFQGGCDDIPSNCKDVAMESQEGIISGCQYIARRVLGGGYSIEVGCSRTMGQISK